MSCCALLAVIHFSLCLLTFFLSLVAAVDCIADSSKCSDICASEQMGAHGCQAECETDRQTDAATDTDRPTHTCTHTLSLTHTHTHTRTHTHTLSHSPPPRYSLTPPFPFAPSCICQTLNTAIWSVISAKERSCPPDGLLRRMYTIFKVMSPVLACGLMGCSSQPGFQDLCVDFKVCCSPSSLFFFFFFFLLLRAPTFLLTHCTHTRARTAQDFVEQGTKDWFQFDANKHHSATDLAEEMKALWYRKGDEAKVIVARHS